MVGIGGFRPNAQALKGENGNFEIFFIPFAVTP